MSPLLGGDGETERKIVAAILIAIVLGGAIGFGSSYMVFNPQIQGLQGDLSRAGSSLNALNTTVNALGSELSRARSDLGALNRTVNGLRNGLDALNTTVLGLESGFAVLDSLVDLMRTAVADLETNLTKAKGEIDEFNLRLAELESRLNFTDFGDMAELRDWLGRDNTSEYEYVSEAFDCDDFALTLMVHGFSGGYKVGTVAVYYEAELWYIYYDDEYWWKVPLAYYVDGYSIFGNHMANIAYVGAVGWVLIEPQTDAVYALGTHEL